MEMYIQGYGDMQLEGVGWIGKSIQPKEGTKTVFGRPVSNRPKCVWTAFETLRLESQEI